MVTPSLKLRCDESARLKISRALRARIICGFADIKLGIASGGSVARCAASFPGFPQAFASFADEPVNVIVPVSCVGEALTSKLLTKKAHRYGTEKVHFCKCKLVYVLARYGFLLPQLLEGSVLEH